MATLARLITVCAALLSVGLSVGLRAQQEGAGRVPPVAGTVTGFDGAPVQGAVVSYISPWGLVLQEGLTDASGAFACEDLEPIAQVQVQLEGCLLRKAVGVRGVPLAFSFADATHFTVRGHVVDPTGAPAVGTDLHLRSGEQDGWLGVVTTGAGGSFAIRVDRTVREVVADPMGWRYRVAGPFAVDTGLAIDLRLELDEFFRIDGVVLDEEGRPLADALVKGLQLEEDHSEARRYHARTGEDGSFSLWANSRLDRLVLRGAFDRRCEVDGPWQAGARVDLDCRKDGFLPVVGRVFDQAGEAVVGATIYPVDARGRTSPVALGRTSTDGWFRVLVKRGTKAIAAELDEGEARAAGPWPVDRVVELRPAKKKND